MSARELTRDQIEAWRKFLVTEALIGYIDEGVEARVNALCDMALASLEPVAMPPEPEVRSSPNPMFGSTAVVRKEDYDALRAWAARGELSGWHEGFPPKPWCKEWFIAQMEGGDRVVLTALPEEYAYDFKTADETYYMARVVKRWMQFPDSQFIAPPALGESKP